MSEVEVLLTLAGAQIAVWLSVFVAGLSLGATRRAVLDTKSASSRRGFEYGHVGPSSTVSVRS